MLPLMQVLTTTVTEEDVKACTLTAMFRYEYEPVTPGSTDCTRYGSTHKYVCTLANG